MQAKPQEAIQALIRSLRELGYSDSTIIEVLLGLGPAGFSPGAAAPAKVSVPAKPAPVAPGPAVETSPKGVQAKALPAGSPNRVKQRPTKPGKRPGPPKSARKAKTPGRPSSAPGSESASSTRAGAADISNYQLGAFKKDARRPDATKQDVAKAMRHPKHPWSLAGAIERRGKGTPWPGAGS